MKFSLEHCLLRIFEWVRHGFGKPNTLVWALATFQEISTRERTRFLSSLSLSLSQKNWNMNSPFCTSIWYFLNWWQKISSPITCSLCENTIAIRWKSCCISLHLINHFSFILKTFYKWSQYYYTLSTDWGKLRQKAEKYITQDYPN